MALISFIIALPLLLDELELELELDDEELVLLEALEELLDDDVVPGSLSEPQAASSNALNVVAEKVMVREEKPGFCQAMSVSRKKLIAARILKK